MQRSFRRVVAVAATVALLPALALALSTPALARPTARPTAQPSAPVPPVSTAATRSAPTPGAVGIGDPYYREYGNGGYDVTAYKIKVRYTPSSDKLKGVTTIKARATQNLSRFNLDLVLKASKVTVNGRRAKISQRDSHELVVTPRKPLAINTNFTVVVRYAGVPSKKRVDGIKPWTRGNGGALAVGEPEIAAWWFPSNDHPRDKAKFDIEIKVPKGVEAISNGVLRRKRTKGKTTTWQWRQHAPMATYLAFFAAGQYAVTSTRAGGRPFVTAVPAKSSKITRRAAADVRRTPEIIAFHSQQFGAYAFGQIGGVVTSAPLGYALETQTRPIYDQSFWDDGPNIYVVVHENAHQWFGDAVSVSNWRDIWLNEGFATYAEWIWSEKHAQGTGQQLLKGYYNSTAASSSFWKVKIGNPGAGKEFDSAVYDRGAMTLQALRNRIGSPALTTVLRTWVQQRRYGNGDIAAFIALAERISKQQLDGFFTAWLYTGAKPAATVANGLGGITATDGARSAAVDATVFHTRAQLDRVHARLAAR